MPLSIRFVIITALLLSVTLIHPAGLSIALSRPGGTTEISRWWNHRYRDANTPRPEWAADRDWFVAHSGRGNSTNLVPVVPPPANLPCASGAKTCAETIAQQVATLPPKTRRYEESRVSMGCVYTIVSYGDGRAPLREASEAALDEVDRIDRLMSNYKKDSELSRVNREAAKAPVKVDPELFDFIAECLRYGRESEGAFDVTVGPLMKAWGFFRGEGRMPGEAELARAKDSVGYQHVILNRKDGTIFFDKPGVEIDLGGIAKGYAVDRAVAVLKQNGVASALVSAGGSTTYALGAPPNKPAWEIEIQDPVERDKIAARVQLKDRALSVSGSYEKFFELNGKRYSHIMDPRTGLPVQGVLSVVVITGDGLSGDALDNVFYVLGVERSKASMKRFSASEVIFFAPGSLKKWKMLRFRRQDKAIAKPKFKAYPGQRPIRVTWRQEFRRGLQPVGAPRPLVGAPQPLLPA